MPQALARLNRSPLPTGALGAASKRLSRSPASSPLFHEWARALLTDADVDTATHGDGREGAAVEAEEAEDAHGLSIRLLSLLAQRAPTIEAIFKLVLLLRLTTSGVLNAWIMDAAQPQPTHCRVCGCYRESAFPCRRLPAR